MIYKTVLRNKYSEMPKDLKSSTNEHEAGVDALAERISKLLHNSIDGYEISSPNAKESSTCSLSSSKVHSSSLNSTSTSGLGSNIGTFQRKEGIWRDNLLWDLDSSNNDKEYSSENIGDEEDKNQSFSKAVSRKYFSGDANLISPEKKTDLSGLNEFCHPKMPNFTQNILIRKPFNPSLHHKFSRKVFVGGLPGDASEADISISFACFGLHSVDWPYRRLDGSCYPPKGYCFILFNSELSVRKLIDCCIKEKNSYYWRLSSPTINNKMVQIRPWVTSDSEFVTPDLLVQCGIQDSEAVNSNTSTKTTCISLESGKQLSKKLHPRKMIFVGGIPRPTKALDLALSLQDNFGKILYAAIDTDSDFHYPKGAGKVLFESRESYIRAIKERFVLVVIK
ncbi:MAG: translation regulator activity [Paramarteilia canceri]